MPVVVIVILAVAAAIIVALILAPPVLQSSASGLRRRFGPEYDRAVREHRGDTRAALRELSERVRRYGDVQPRPLPPQEREQYVARWAGLQERFVDAPAATVTEAADLLDRLATERGFPEGAEHRADALSLHYAPQVEGYRELRRVAGRADAAETGTEELRKALVAARPLFTELVVAQPADRPAQRRLSRVPRQSGGRYSRRHRNA
ncbi:hypothetical protein [Streptomyces sp. NPDC018031]|uniref:hypothetical protein n=1 Tax=Streptomyces sp. NPDC018031 TaxID=3365033 RepID=UPI00379FCFC4